MDGVEMLLVLLVALVAICEANKYAGQFNQENETPFKMMKVNMIWQKAKMRLRDESRLSDLYQDLKHQDQLESDLKKRRAVEDDQDGEFEALVRRKLLDLVTKYNLEGIQPLDFPKPRTNDVNDGASKPEKQLMWERVMEDKRLSKLWKKAQLAGFSDKELGALRAELLHHVDKVAELKVLQADGPGKGLRDNSVHGLKESDSLREERDKHLELKTKYKEVRDDFGRLEEKVLSQRTTADEIAAGFRHPKVLDLWFNARSSNFTKKELVSIQEELAHFEHKLNKLEILEQEHGSMKEKVKDKNRQLGDFPDKTNKVADKVKDYSRKIKKYETDIRSRIDRGTTHLEL